jgi:hypothetical protein
MMHAAINWKQPGRPTSRSIDLTPYVNERGWERALATVNSMVCAEHQAQWTPAIHAA